MIRDNGCGFIVPPGAPSALADALEYAAANPSLLRIMGGKSRVLAESEFNRAKLSKRSVDTPENALEDRRTASKQISVL